jgi:hypothetical protein
MELSPMTLRMQRRQQFILSCGHGRTSDGTTSFSGQNNEGKSEDTLDLIPRRARQQEGSPEMKAVA